jgi:hypothetical protein
LSNNPIPNILAPQDLGLLGTDPGSIAKILNDAAQHLSPNDPNVAGWESFGCFTSPDLFTGSLTAVASVSINDPMSPQLCINLCIGVGVDYSSVIGGSCYCSAQAPPSSAGSTKCTTPCAGAGDLTCGNPGDGGFSFFKRLVTPNSPVPVPARPAPNDYQYSGCYFANDFIRGATYILQPSTGISDCSAAAAARGFTYAGLQGDACYASNTPPTADSEAGIGLCTTPCTGNTLEACGGSTSPINTGSGQTQLVTLYSALTAPTTDAPVPDTSVTGPTGPGNFFVDGCFNAGAFVLDSIVNGLQISYAAGSGVNNGAQQCFFDCYERGFDYALTQSSTCYCNRNPPTTRAASQSDCNLACPGNPSERCGGQGDPNGPDGGVLGNLYSALAIDLPILVRFSSFLSSRCSV